MFYCVVSLGLNYMFMNVSHEHRPVYLMKKKNLDKTFQLSKFLLFIVFVWFCSPGYF